MRKPKSPPTPLRIDAVSYGEKMYEQGHKTGHLLGYQEGLKEGREQGRQQAFARLGELLGLDAFCAKPRAAKKGR